MSFDIKIGNPNGPFSYGGHDIILDKIGKTISLYGQDKLTQDIEKIFFTDVNNFYAEYSTQLNELIGSNLGIQETVNILYQRILDSLIYLQILQEEQAKSQQVQADEIIESIISVNVNYLYDITSDGNDVRSFKVDVVVQNANGQQINVNKDVSVV